jgi:hypothetical protein
LLGKVDLRRDHGDDQISDLLRIEDAELMELLRPDLCPPTHLQGNVDWSFGAVELNVSSTT